MRYLAHRGDELEKCTAIHPAPGSLKLLTKVMKRMQLKRERFVMAFHDDGRVKIHGES